MFRSTSFWMLTRSPTHWRPGRGDTTTAPARGQGELLRARPARVVTTLQRVHVSRRRFESLVAEALDDLPEALLEHSENVVVLVEDTPPADMLGDAEGDTLFGLYEGVAHTDRGLDAPFLPDRITLFRLPLADACADEDALFAEIRVTLVHEFAHHFGIDDDRLDELGWA
jgi:predicted Zn-dependent protease with MMP-like domain